MRRLTSTTLVFLVLLAAAVGVKLADPPLVAQLRLQVFDAYQRLAPRAPGDAPVRIVAIDDESLARIGQWPWPRSTVADLVERLQAMGAAVIALGVIFAEPDRGSPAAMLEQLRRLPGFSLDAQPRALLRDNDATLAAVITDASVVASFALTERANAARPAVRWGLVTAGDDPRPFLPRFAGAVVNLEIIETAAPAQGALNVLPDVDGVVRAVPLLAVLGEEVYPALAAEVLRHAQGASTYVVRTAVTGQELGWGGATGVTSVRIGQLELPTTAAGGSLIYYSGSRAERFVPAWQVLDGTADAARLTGHVVLVGASATGLGDLVATPLGTVVPGIEVQAELLEQLLLGVRLVRPDWAEGAELLFLVVVGGLLLVVLDRLGAVSGALVGFVAVAAAIIASLLAFLRYGVLLDPVLPCLALLGVYLAATVAGYIRAEGERAEVRRAFGLYLSPALLRRLAANPQQLKLGGETRELTVLFSDVRGFTGIAETMTAEQLTRFLNRYLTPMTDVIQDHDGTIDKYMGDGIMAFWNAPLDVPEHGRQACRAALEMRRRLAALNDELATETGPGFKAIRIGIGLNTGPCSVGNLGSERRFSYSAIGEPVNLAARFEGQCKVYGVDILISVRTRTAAPELATLELDVVRTVGTTRPEPVYALLGDRELAQTEDFRALLAAHEAMRAAYRAAQFADALKALDRCRSSPLAPPLAEYYRQMAARIDQLAAAPLPPGWDGVVVAEQK